MAEINFVRGKFDHHLVAIGTKPMRCCKCQGVSTSYLPMECPGSPITEAQLLELLEGRSDFYNGQWREVANSEVAFRALQEELKRLPQGSVRSVEIQRVLASSFYRMDSKLGFMAKQPLIREGWIPEV